ncbi:unnamed protein product [Parnassius apollo]|uniref:(apollo) hypothetical protein n=1 Tax=Parnassius apollo TaxID=110799 RepID=A0A8S3XEQ5_PARAO|nr:unnamed protein product [Parnassius apollo]
MDNRNRAKKIVNMALQSLPPPSSSTSTNEDFSSDHSSYHPQQNVEISTELEDSEAERDKRGKHVPANKLSDEKLNWIKDHINSFPKFVSHYGERRSTRKYLRPDLSMNKMYELFKAKCESEGKPILKKSAYVKVFTTEFNLHFYIPKDTCKTCDMLEIEIKAEEDIETCLAIRVQKRSAY